MRRLLAIVTASLMALMLLLVINARADERDLVHYHAQQEQGFIGLVCDTEPMAKAVASVWLDPAFGQDEALQLGRSFRCSFIGSGNPGWGYFHDLIVRGKFNLKLADGRYEMHDILVFGLSRTKAPEPTAWLVTWEKLDPDA